MRPWAPARSIDRATVSLPYHADNSGQLVYGGDDQIPRRPPLHRRQHVHVGLGRRATAGNPQDHRDDATAPVALHFHRLENVRGPHGHGVRRGRRDLLALYTAWHDPADDERYLRLGPSRIWRRCRIWQPASRSPTRIWPGVRRSSSPTPTWPASIRCAPPTTRMAVFHSWMAQRITARSICLQRALEQYLAVVGGNHLHRGDLIDRRRDAAGGRRGMTRVRRPRSPAGCGCRRGSPRPSPACRGGRTPGPGRRSGGR